MKKLVLALAALSLILTGCGGGSSAPKGKTLTVLAASSLTGAFTDLAAKFEAANSGAHVKLVFDSSAALVSQLAGGAPAGVLATADQKTIDQARSQKLLGGSPSEFATNVLVLGVPKANPAKIKSVTDLNKSGVAFLTCVTTAPCGSAAEALMKADHVTAHPASQEVDVKSVLAKLISGEADAGFVYATDVKAADGNVIGIEVPGAAASPNTYWIAATAHPKHPDLAQAWVAFVTGPEGRAILAKDGFGSVG